MGRAVRGVRAASRIVLRAARSAGGRVGWGCAAMGGATGPAVPGGGERISAVVPRPPHREEGAGESPEAAPPAVQAEGAAEGGWWIADGAALGGRGGRPSMRAGGGRARSPSLWLARLTGLLAWGRRGGVVGVGRGGGGAGGDERLKNAPLLSFLR